MDRDTIRQAIMLFQHSRTGSGLNGPLGTLASQVVQRLWQLYRGNEIGYAILPAGTAAQWTAGDPGYDMQISMTHVVRIVPETHLLPWISLRLVHEAVHAIFPAHYIDEELACRELQIHYYRELRQGVVHEAAEWTGVPTPVIQIPHDGVFVHLRRQNRLFELEQLVDYIVSKLGRDYRNSLTPTWIRTNATHWGGLKNRWADTRGHYLAELIANGSSADAGLILDILESVDNPSDWRKMMRHAGPPGPLQNLLGVNNDHLLRMYRLEQKWNVKLISTGKVVNNALNAGKGLLQGLVR